YHIFFTINNESYFLSIFMFDNNYYFLMTHECSLRVVACRSKTVRQGVNDTYGLAGAGHMRACRHSKGRNCREGTAEVQGNW
ncbi:hypothetical protein, partial [Pseudomonas fluorescens]|uniref:hypothetical protein n=1 Tax=Pseudomonas fluorescens TaxID=294 RepID=UPI0037F5496C